MDLDRRKKKRRAQNRIESINNKMQLNNNIQQKKKLHKIYHFYKERIQDK